MDDQGLSGDSPDVVFSRRAFLSATGLLAGRTGLGSAERSDADQRGPVRLDAFSIVLDATPKRIELARAFPDPVVIAGPLSFEGRQPAVARVREVTKTAFTVSVAEWSYLDGEHADETVGCLVVNAGTYTLDDGTLLAGTVEASGEWTSVSFPSRFETAPIVLSTPQTTRTDSPVVTRHRNVSDSGFDLRLQDAEGSGDLSDELVGYLAIDPGSWTVGEWVVSAGFQGGVNHQWNTIAFDETFQEPSLMADIQTYDGPDPSTVRYRNLTATDVDVKVEEEGSRDEEVEHRRERVGYLVIDGATADPGSGGQQVADAVRYGQKGYGQGGFGRPKR